jgi:hypothetical protein
MKTAVCKLVSASPYSQSKPIVSEIDQGNETSAEFEARTWRERMHVTDDGYVFIPPTQFWFSIAEAAKYKSLNIPGKGKATYTKHFEAGVMVTEPLVLDVKADDVPGQDLFVPSNGVRGAGSRVWKTFPLIKQWEGVVTYHILDDLINEDVFRAHLEDSGRFIGVGRFRPRNRGFYGRFDVKELKWSKA